MLVFCVLSGGFVCLSSVPEWISWISYLSPFRYTYDLVLINQWQHVANIGCNKWDQLANFSDNSTKSISKRSPFVGRYFDSFVQLARNFIVNSLVTIEEEDKHLHFPLNSQNSGEMYSSLENHVIKESSVLSENGSNFVSSILSRLSRDVANNFSFVRNGTFETKTNDTIIHNDTVLN